MLLPTHDIQRSQPQACREDGQRSGGFYSVAFFDEDGGGDKAGCGAAETGGDLAFQEAEEDGGGVEGAGGGEVPGSVVGGGEVEVDWHFWDLNKLTLRRGFGRYGESGLGQGGRMGNPWIWGTGRDTGLENKDWRGDWRLEGGFIIHFLYDGYSGVPSQRHGD